MLLARHIINKQELGCGESPQFMQLRITGAQKQPGPKLPFVILLRVG